MADEKKEVKKTSKEDAFIGRKLRVINEMEDGRKKAILAERIMRNKGVK